MQRETFAPDLEQILAPVSPDEPCGPSVRYEPAFMALRQARTEDDASLPMREWERPLKKADWRGVANDCAAMLGKSKDVQLAAWLCDAWVRQHQIEGFNAGADLLVGLVERHWKACTP
jgi:type VI secretion system protein ImpA